MGTRYDNRTTLTIIIDTREQEPYTFDSPDLLTIRQKLETGDYSAVGHEAVVTVERKTLADFVNTLTNGRVRFYRELQRMKEGIVCPVIVVEGSLDNIIFHQYQGGMNPNSLIGFTCQIMMEYGVPVVFCSSRPSARRFTESWIRQAVTCMGDDAATVRRLAARALVDQYRTEEAENRAGIEGN